MSHIEMQTNAFHIDFESLKPVLKEWAKQYPEIHAIVVFGSRAKGTNRPDSDLDLCVLVDSYDEDDWYTRWFEHAEKWKRELVQIIQIPEEALQLCSVTSEKVRSGLEEASRFLYVRDDKSEKST